MSSAANRKVESQTMEDILNSIRRIIVDDQQNAHVSDDDRVTYLHEDRISTNANDYVSPDDAAIENDILALRRALNTIRDEMDQIQGSIVDPTLSLSGQKNNAFPDSDELLPDSEDRSSFVSPAQPDQLPFLDQAEVEDAVNQQLEIEIITTSLVRPILQKWLDENLNSLVERLLNEEIAARLRL